MACGCGKNCGPIIVRPEVDLGDVTVDTGPDHELRVLCDADGVAFLRRWSIAHDGTVTTADTELDGQTSFTPVEPVGVCAPGETDESPGDGCVHCTSLRLFDQDQPFVRTVCRDCSGAIVSVTDADLDGNDYVVGGAVTTCCPDTEESPGEQVTGHPVILCDHDGDTSTPFVRTYLLVNGQIAGVEDSDLTGADYTATGSVGVCAPEEESPAEECGSTNVLQLCDRVPATGPDEPPEITRFLRHLTYDCAGVVIASADTLLDGQTAYTVAGEVGACEPEPVECGLPPDAITSGQTNSGQPGEMQVADTAVPQPYGPTYFTPSAHIPLPGGGGPLWAGGTLTFPGEPDGSAGDGKQVYRAVAAILQADRLPCDDGTADVSVTVDLTNEGPADGFAHSAAMFVFAAGRQVGFVDLRRTPAGATETLTINATVSAQDLAAGRLMVLLEAETFHRGSKTWTADNFVATYAYGTDGCGEPAPAMNVKICGPVTIGGGMLSGGGSTPSNSNSGCCQQILERRGCDDTDGDGVADATYAELWSVSTDPDGDDPVLVGTYVDGDLSTPYTPVNPVPCVAEPEPIMCGLGDDDVVSGSTGDGTLTVTDSAEQLRASSDTLLREQVSGGAQALWSGGAVTFGPDTDPPGSQFIVHRYGVGVVQADRPNCDDGTVQIDASVRITNDGPDAGFERVGVVALYNGDALVAKHQVTFDPPVGHQETFSFSETVAAADLAAGRLKVLVELETYHQTSKQWTVDQFEASYTYGVEGCADEVPASYVRICGPVTIGGGMLSAGGTTGGTGGEGGSATASAQQILERRRCDDTDGDGIPDVSFVELYKLDEDDTPVRIGTYLADDLTQPYAPVSPVDCDTTVVCETEDGPGLAQLVKSCEDTCEIGSGIIRQTATAGVPLSITLGAIARLQSVTLTVLSGPDVTVTTDDGMSAPVPAGTSLTWSVARNRDDYLGEWSAEVPDGGDAIAHFTYCKPIVD